MARREYSLTLALACSEVRRMEACVALATQLGAAHLIAFTCKNSPVDSHACIGSLRSAARAAALDAQIPEPSIEGPLPFAELLGRFGAHRRVAFCWESADMGATGMVSALSGASEALAVVGPVDGFEAAEAKAAFAAGAIPVTLGPCVLGVEAACAAAVTLAVHALSGEASDA